MSSESVTEGLVVGPEMRIRLAKQSEGVDHDNSNNHDDDGDGDGGGDDNQGEVVKKEVVQEQIYECPTSEQRLKSGEYSSTLAQLSNTPRTLSPSPSYTGKRKRKPNEMHDKICCQSKDKKKQPLLSKSKHAVPDHALKSMSCKLEKTAINGPHGAVKVKAPLLIQAEQVQSSLGSKFPSFAKLMVRSHVASCFWMGLPVPFCKLHLPRKDATVTLENESADQFEVKFIAEKPGLSAGWRKFVAGHKLLEGDVLIFQLVEPTKFKVYIMRANDLTEVDGALSLLNLDAHTKQNDKETDGVEKGEIALKNKKRKHLKSLPLAVVQKKNKKTGHPKSVPKPIQSAEQFENDSEEVGSEVLVGPRFSGSAVQFRDVKSFEDFNILVDGLCIDSELPEQIRAKYYELCCSKNEFIHARLLRGLNCWLAAGIICETVNIADAIRSCKLTTSRDEFTIWEKTLKSFEVLGMNVGFLRAHLRRLLSLAFKSEGALDTRKYLEAKAERVRAEYEIRNLEAKLVELKEAAVNFDADIEALKSKAEIYELKFQEEVDAPW